MIDYMILMISQTKVGWVIVGVFGLIAAFFAVYYIAFALYLIGASIYTGIKLIPQSYRIWREDLAASYGSVWHGAEIGVTMPDGGKPVEKKEKKEPEEEKEEKEKEA